MKLIEKNSILRALADFDNRKIIFSIVGRPRTVKQIIAYTKLPDSSVFKKISELERLELIKSFDVELWYRKYSEGEDLSRGPKPKVYISAILGAKVNIMKENIDINLIENLELEKDG